MPRSLSEYQRKRDFSKTPEPKGVPDPSGGNRFVVQKHWATRLHYDFRLEMEGVLVSWAIPKGPTLNPAERRLAAHVEDHPVDYYDFEGTIPKGEYGGGTVMVWDWGTFELEEATPAVSIKRGEVKFRLHGVRLCGRYALVRTRSDKDWLLIKKKDECADPSFDIEKFATSVKTGRTKEEIEQGKDAVWSSRREEGAGGLINLANAEKGSMPKTLDPMKAQLVDDPFDNERWLFEVKWDGIRLVTFIDGDTVTLQTRAGRTVNDEYPQLQAMTRLVKAKQAILDGEIVVFDEEGRPSFQLWQNRGREARQLHYMVYDIVYFDGQRLFRVPLEDRKRLLRDVILDSDLVRYSDHVIGEGKAFFKAAREKQLEGIVAKLRDSPYQPGVRSAAWLKIKTTKQQDVVIGGFTAGRNSRKYFGAILVGVYDDKGRFVYAGHTGGGFDEKTLAALYERMKPLITKESPFAGTPPHTNEKPTWVKPELVAEVKFAEWTRDGVMRQPVFVRLRDDIDPKSVRREDPEDTDQAASRAESSETTTAAIRSKAKSGTKSKVAAKTKPPAKTRAAVARRTITVARSRSTTGVTAKTTTPSRSTAKPATSRDLPDTPLSRAAAQISKKLGTNIRGATAAELEALDAMPKEGHWEIGGRTVHLTNLDKLLFPEDRYSKRDLIRYYVQVAPVMIPHYSRRPLSMNPHPDGIHGKSYWVKDKPGYAPEWIPTFRYRDQKSLKDWILIEEVATLAWLANHAVIDMHPWYSRVDKPEYPDWSVVDLDPAEGATFNDVVDVARVVKSALDHLKLKALLKTTGQSGLHVYIPIERRYTLDESRGFVATLAHMIAELMPDKVTEVWEVKRRTGKIRIDYTQNVINKTLAGPYSVRPALRAPVSTPIRWEELDDSRLRPDKWTIKTLGERLLEVGDLFHDALTLHQRLPAL
ncbi:MAG TPA: non-homologous end-joining DNA ligase [Candidatus Dormibacteraeota bacterium]|nr:non-homologous end-joining DNA ligase [Candidatus Dormibacteraeota bacterium]